MIGNWVEACLGLVSIANGGGGECAHSEPFEILGDTRLSMYDPHALYL